MSESRQAHTPTNRAVPGLLLLFDIDGVLIFPRGYKEALRAAVDHFAVRMGQPPAGITYDEIAIFEACGITNEWDSVPMCVGALLVDALAGCPDLVQTSIDDTLLALAASSQPVPRPDFAALAHAVRAEKPPSVQPTATIHRLLRARSATSACHLVDELLGNVYSLASPTTRVFQQFSLGSDLFRQTFGAAPDVESSSMLANHDSPLISPAAVHQLLAQVAAGEIGITIYTARPSRPPRDLAGLSRPAGHFLYPPEGELAAHLLGLDGHVPLIAAGRLAWLAEQTGRQPADYLKPSPVQALAAIGAAVSGTEQAALEAAVALVEHGHLRWPLAALQGCSTRIVVFEDSTGGIEAVRRAVEMLQAAGLSTSCEATGIASEPPKQAALSGVADIVAQDINHALSRYVSF
jgi:hypothetical protein